jgi:starch synthase
MKILLVTAELAPMASAGGVGQYVLGLAKVLLGNKHDVRVAIPNYAFFPKTDPPELKSIKVERLSSHPHFASAKNTAGIYKTTDFMPWVDFAKSTVEFLRKSDWTPDIVHCMDGHASLVPVYIAEARKADPAAFTNTRTVLTIHNLLEKGEGPREFFDRLDLPASLYDTRFEFYGKTCCYKAGILSADRVSTVSVTYAREIAASEDYGFGLAGVLRSLPHPPVGIVNGIDAESWTLPGAKYDGSDAPAGVIRQKRAKLAEILPDWAGKTREPVIAFKARWDRQKGIELLTDCMEEILESARFVFDTWGEPKGGEGIYLETWNTLRALSEKYPLRLAVNAPGTASMKDSGNLYTLADFLVMPSVYEPCGLAQMECQRFGCVPIARKTGGLADTVEDPAGGAEGPNGFLFDALTRRELLSAVKRAVKTHADSSKMKKLIANALVQKNDWRHRVGEYEKLYRDALE